MEKTSIKQTAFQKPLDMKNDQISELQKCGRSRTRRSQGTATRRAREVTVLSICEQFNLPSSASQVWWMTRESKNNVHILLNQVISSQTWVVMTRSRLRHSADWIHWFPRRGVRSDAQLRSTETRFQKCSQRGKNGSKHPMLSISMAFNVISCKKNRKKHSKTQNRWFYNVNSAPKPRNDQKSSKKRITKSRFTQFFV